MKRVSRFAMTVLISGPLNLWRELSGSLARTVEPRGVIELAITLLLVAGTTDRREVRRRVDIELQVPSAAGVARENVIDLQVRNVFGLRHQ